MGSSPNFFKIVLQKSLDDGKLMFPKRFARDHGKFLLSPVRLKLPDGLEWEVGLTTTINGAVWLQNGWPRFAEHYCLEFGSFLVFRFDGNSTFHTSIYDLTGSEIEYTCNFNDTPEGSYSPKMEREEEYNNVKRMPGNGVARGRQPLSSAAKKAEAAAQRLSVLKSEKPSFELVMRQSNVGGRFNLFFPKEFAGKYFGKEIGTIILQTSDGRTWSLLCRWFRGKSQGRGDFAYVSHGWRTFVEDNLLKEGDVGFFQLIKKDQFLFTIKESSSLSRKNEATTRYPFLEVHIRVRSYKTSFLNIPASFAKEHLSPITQTAKLLVGVKQWKVKLLPYKGYIRLTAGWAAFYRENSLGDGDKCLFELVSKRDCVFEVTIYKKVTIEVD